MRPIIWYSSSMHLVLHT
ncbi:hypothetical protein F383_32504 [Gossypium arboreum]|uniref:Uncharacterized protein n=1 Tax=Gossypium arboreum TaxID=29729 RepID=A0A0B0PL28_GOSAR|nr:hypothetical protein F383_32504 [Gossypium arboreum]